MKQNKTYRSIISAIPKAGYSAVANHHRVQPSTSGSIRGGHQIPTSNGSAHFLDDLRFLFIHEPDVLQMVFQLGQTIVQ